MLYIPLLLYYSILYYFVYLPLSASFIFPFAFVLLSSVLLFQLEGLSLVFLIILVQRWGTPSIFIFLGNSLFLFHFWKPGFAWCSIFFSFSPLIISSHSFLTSKFLLRNLLCYGESLYVVSHFCTASKFSFCLCLLTIRLLYILIWTSLVSSLLESVGLPETGCSFPFPDLGKVQPVFLQINFLPLSSSRLLMVLP